MSTSTTDTDYETFRQKMGRIADVNHAMGVLSWDQETYMPPEGWEFRGQQLATLSGIAHEMSTDQDLVDLLARLKNRDDLSREQQRNVKEALRDQKKNLKYPDAFVREMSQQVSRCFQAWGEAKKNDDFARFAPELDQLVEMKKRECDLLGYEAHPYDALLDQFEPGQKTVTLDELFRDVKEKMSGLIGAIRQQEQNEDAFMFRHYDHDQQWAFGLYLLEQMGYDRKSGRQDISSHPFTTSFSPLDVRVTTRVDETDLNEMIWSCIHEGGHALYEQGLLPENYGLPAGEACSLGIHESQARLWENIIGRGWPFWQANFGELQKRFPDQLGEVLPEAFYRGINIVKPTLIRTNADELTYHFHILIRYEIEKALIEGEIKVKELPEVWNAKYKEYLGIEVPSDAQGVLQDVHWSHGAMGYFPTYSLGSFFSAQFYHQARRDIDGLEDSIVAGDLHPLLNWLREKIHRHGRLYLSEALCEAVTGEQLDLRYFMDYAIEKYAWIYRMDPEVLREQCGRMNEDGSSGEDQGSLS